MVIDSILSKSVAVNRDQHCLVIHRAAAAGAGEVKEVRRFGFVVRNPQHVWRGQAMGTASDGDLQSS